MQIILESGLTDKPIERIIVENFQASDVSLDVGTKRDVDKFVVKFEGGAEMVMTVSLDKQSVAKKYQSPSLQETSVLEKVRHHDIAWSVQRWLGSTFIEDKDGTRGLICKEFIPGFMLANYTSDVAMAIDAYGLEAMRQLAYAVGRMVANVLVTLGGIPIDSNGLNIIVTEDSDGSPRTRYCDVEMLRTSKKDIKKEIGLIKRELAELGAEFVKGLKKNYSGNLIE